MRILVERLSNGIGDLIPVVCQNWANTKAAYRFFSNERVSEGEILAGHFHSTAERFRACEGPVLPLQDITFLPFSAIIQQLSGFPANPIFRKEMRGKRR
ncbi:IS4/Tn5 family transposase DNA-binding protein [Massilia sp. PWRC2]|uniref:IS4/Tn5 family transposase DNA-binding protein n=1 Tax=Massilia sp. PWRC2 TaxID=2804626 RepID=UPI003CE9DF1E